jgi:hypothetical protein
MSSRRTSNVPKEDVVFPKMLYCDLRCSQTLTGLSPALPGTMQCNATRRLGDGQRVILRQRIRDSVRAVRAVRNTRVFQMETRVVADEPLGSYIPSEYSPMMWMEPYAYNLQPVHFNIAIEICQLHVCNEPKMNAPVGRF